MGLEVPSDESGPGSDSDTELPTRGGAGGAAGGGGGGGAEEKGVSAHTRRRRCRLVGLRTHGWRGGRVPLVAAAPRCNAHLCTASPRCPDCVSQFESAPKPKGVAGIIDIQNPNMKRQKFTKVSELSADTKVELTRRERDELRAQAEARKALLASTSTETEEGRREHARLAEIRKAREEAAARREAELKAKAERAEAARKRSEELAAKKGGGGGKKGKKGKRR